MTIELETADKVDDEIYSAWRKYKGYGVPMTDKGMESFTTDYYAFQAGWKYAMKKSPKELSDEEIRELYCDCMLGGFDPYMFARAILKKANEK